MMEMAFLDHEQMCIPVRVPISIFNTGMNRRGKLLPTGILELTVVNDVPSLKDVTWKSDS